MCVCRCVEICDSRVLHFSLRGLAQTWLIAPRRETNFDGAEHTGFVRRATGHNYVGSNYIGP